MQAKEEEPDLITKCQNLGFEILSTHDVKLLTEEFTPSELRAGGHNDLSSSLIEAFKVFKILR